MNINYVDHINHHNVHGQKPTSMCMTDSLALDSSFPQESNFADNKIFREMLRLFDKMSIANPLVPDSYSFPQEHINQKITQNIAKPTAMMMDQSLAFASSIYESDVRILNHATESFEWKKLLISSAKQSIELSPNFAGGENFREVLQLIAEQMQKEPQLKVHILLSRDLLEELDIKMLECMEKSPHFHYIISDRQYMLLPFPHSEENHEKLLIVDGKYYGIGGLGIHPRMAREITTPEEAAKDTSLKSKMIAQGFRDTDLIAHGGDIAHKLRIHFFQLYQKWENRTNGTEKAPNRFFSHCHYGEKGSCSQFHQIEGLFQNVKLNFITNAPNDDGITRLLEKRLSKAKKQVTIANFLFNPTDSIITALEKTKKNNVHITVFGSAEATATLPVTIINVIPARKNYHLANTVYEYEVPGQLYHKKVFTFDDIYTVIGGYNLGTKSALCDDEIAVIIKDKRITNFMSNSFEDDKKLSKKIHDKELIDISKRYSLAGTIINSLIGSCWI